MQAASLSLRNVDCEQLSSPTSATGTCSAVTASSCWSGLSRWACRSSAPTTGTGRATTTSSMCHRATCSTPSWRPPRASRRIGSCGSPISIACGLTPSGSLQLPRRPIDRMHPDRVPTRLGRRRTGDFAVTRESIGELAVSIDAASDVAALDRRRAAVRHGRGHCDSWSPTVRTSTLGWLNAVRPC